MTFISKHKHHLKLALRWIHRVVLPLSLVFLLYYAWQTRDTLQQVLADAVPELLLCSIALWLLCHLLAPITSVLVFRGSHINLSYRDAFLIHAKPLPARYLPGGIWHSVSRFAMLHGHDADRHQLLSFFLIENSLAVGVSIALGCASLLWFGALGDIEILALLGLGAALIGLMAVPLLLRRGSIPGTAAIPVATYFVALTAVTLFWLVAASAFACFAAALGNALGEGSALETGGIYLVSWGIGYLSIFTPQGVGVFELVAGNLLNSGLALGDAVVVIAGFRIVLLIADGLAWLISQLIPTSPTATP